MLPEVTRKAYAEAMTRASKEMDTWKCPTCSHELQIPGSYHLEWGSPSCKPCHDETGKDVKLELIAIESVN